MNIEDVWSEYKLALMAFLRSKVSNEADVQDLLQDVLIKSYQNLHSLKADSSLKSWLFQITNNTIIDYYRRNGKNQGIQSTDLQTEENLPEIEQELSLCIEPLLKNLPEKMSELLIAIDLRGQSQKSYAEQHNLKYSTLKSRVKKARGQLRKMFENCCYLTLDPQGNVADYDLKEDHCKSC